jgi:hypothetical protein
MYTVRAAHFANISRMTGRKDLGVSKEYKTEQAAAQHGINSLVKERDGHNFCVILGPGDTIKHRTV